MDSTPFFDVVIPVHNRCGTIGAALTSVAAQDYSNLRLIVVDDGSTDGTADAVRCLAPDAQVIRQSNQGASVARNVGVEAATARWVAFLDSDDVWCPGHLRRMAAAIRATDGAAHFYFADTIPDWTPENQTLWQLAGFGVDGDHELAADAADWALLPTQPMMLQSAVFDREHYRNAGGLRGDLRCRHDTHLFLIMGIGRPACAVAGSGVRMTGDDRSGHRLTTAFGPRTPSYAHETVALYADVLARGHGLRLAQRLELRSRIAAAHLQLARHAKREGRLATSLGHIARAAVAHPGRFLSGAAGRLLRRSPRARAKG